MERTGTVFHSGNPLVEIDHPHYQPFLSSDSVTWGIAPFFTGYACSIEDSAGIVVFNIGFPSRTDAEVRAKAVIGSLWSKEGNHAARQDSRTLRIVTDALEGSSFPLHMVLTPFQERVLRMDCTIPRGEVRTYGWIARQLGKPGASRAVANALHNNPVAVIVPCHRVIPSNGSVGGFACGTALKSRILQREGVAIDDANCLVLPV